MSLVTETLDRLTGIAVVREKLFESGQRAERFAKIVMDHEKRLVRIETLIFAPTPPARLPGRKK